MEVTGPTDALGRAWQEEYHERGERTAARMHVFALVRDVQDGLAMGREEIEALISQAEGRGWPEVARAALFLHVVAEKQIDGHVGAAAVTRLLARAVSDRDQVATAMALALSAQVRAEESHALSVAADRDLARATVLLEAAEAGTLELACAHIECAIAYHSRNLWELELDHYRAAEELPRAEQEDLVVLPAVRFDRAELQLNWVLALRELDDRAGLLERIPLAREALLATEMPTMPDSWRDELEIFRALLEAITAGVDLGAARGPEVDRPDPAALRPVGEYGGYVHLARSLTVTDPGRALIEAQAAVATIDAERHPNAHSLALCRSGELETTVSGRDTAGLAYARYLARMRWRARLTALASAESLLHAERLRSEHTILSRHAYLDDLTRLGNRRAQWRHLDRLTADGVNRLSVVLVDIDHFKLVNDNHGHAIGDQVLIRIGDLLRAAAGVGDLAVRLGGDEFMLLLTSVSPRAARRRAETLRAAVAAEHWEEISAGLAVTVSVGVAAGRPEHHDRLVQAADEALYEAKAAGRERTQRD